MTDEPDSPNWQLEAELEPSTSSDEPPSPPPLLKILEAMLFVGGSPLTLERARAGIRGLQEEQFMQLIDELTQKYRRQGRPYGIQPEEGGYVLSLRPRYRVVVERLRGQTREARLSTAAVDVLSLVAYRQPVSKTEVDTLRGGESGSILRQLVRRGLVALSHERIEGQKQVLYTTTPRFLELFGLSSLDDLPQTQDLQRQ